MVRRYAVALGVVAGYLAAALVALHPFVRYSGKYCIGGGELGGWLWRYDWLKQQAVIILSTDWSLKEKALTILALGQYPETGNVTDILTLNFPLEALFGFPAYYNIKCLLLIVTAGLGGYALLRHLVRRRGVAFLGGLVLALNPYMLRELYNCGLRQSLLVFIPLYLLFLIKALGVPSARGEDASWDAGWYPGGRRLGWAAAAGVFAGLTSGFYWFYGIFCVIQTAVVLGWRLFHPGRRSIVLPLAVIALTSVVATLPFAMPYIKSYQEQQFLTETTFLESFPSYDEIQYYVADGYRPVTQYESYVASLNRLVLTSKPAIYLFDPREEYPIPYAIGILALLMLPFGNRRNWPWFLGFALFFVLTLGPFLKWDQPHQVVAYGDVAAVRLPYTWFFYAVPGFSRLFGPYRICSMVYVCLMALAAINLAGIQRRIEGTGAELWRRVASWVPGGVFVALLLVQLISGGFMPLSYCNLDLPPFYKRLAASAGAVGIVELPFNQPAGTVDDYQDAVYYYQAFHWKRVLGDWANPGSIHPALTNLDATRTMRAYTRNDRLDHDVETRFLHGSLDRGEISEADMEILREAGYLYVILHEAGYDGAGGRNERPIKFRDVLAAYEEILGEPFLEEEEYPPLESAHEAESGGMNAYRMVVFYLGTNEET